MKTTNSRLLLTSFLSIVSILLFLPGHLLAEPDDVVPKLEIDLGAGALVGPWSKECDSYFGLISCSQKALMPEFAVSGRYRTGRLALGGIGSLGPLRVSDKVIALMWRAAIDGRYYTPLSKVTDLWFSVELGVVGAYGESRATATCCGDGADSEKRWGPEIGAGIGTDFKIGNRFTLGLNLRALWLVFLGPSEQTSLSILQLNRTVWFSGGIHGRFSFPL